LHRPAFLRLNRRGNAAWRKGVNCRPLAFLRAMTDASRLSADRGHLWLGALVFLLTLLAAVWFVRFVVDTGDRQEHERILSLARTTAATLESARIAALEGSMADVGKADFDAVRDELRRARDVNPDFRFVYLMRPSPDAAEQMMFLADAESPESPDYSAPGDPYDGPSDELWFAWREGLAVVEPAYVDDWGHWVTSVAPVRDAGGTVIAVLGMDMRADAWNATLARYRAFAIAISALVLLLEAVFLLGLHRQKAGARRLADLNARLAQQLQALEQAQAGLRLAGVVVQHTGEAIVVLDQDLKVVSANPGFARITGHAQETVTGHMLPLFGHNDEDTLAQIRSRLQQSVHWAGILWATRADGERFPMEASIDTVRDAAGEPPQYVMVFRDVTVQKRLEDRLRELSTTDALTLLANRRGLDEALEREWHRAMRNGHPVSLLMVDIDYFKPFNDLYGHLAGDRCLQQVASALADAASREGATVARYGGEEFAVILPRSDAAAARTLAEVLRQRVEALDIPHRGNPDAGRVTISIGISTRIAPPSSDFEDLMHSADQALYQAKQGGRNIVTAEV